MSQAIFHALARELGREDDQVFSAPWEARAFAIALGLSEAGLFSWDDFRTRLIAEISRADRIRERDGTSDQGQYYDYFVRALEAVLIEQGIISASDLEAELALIRK